MAWFVDFVGLNSLVSSSVNTTTNTIESGRQENLTGPGRTKGISVPDTIVGINTHRNGPYGWPTWKQIRVGENPVSRYHRANSDLTYIKEPGDIINMVVQTSQGFVSLPNFGRQRYSTLVSKEEPAVCQKSFPMRLHYTTHDNSPLSSGPPLQSRIDKSTVGLNLEHFANHTTNIDHRVTSKDIRTQPSAYLGMINKYLNGNFEGGSTSMISFGGFHYKETVFPKARNMFRKEVRTRPDFFSYFRHNRLDRNQTFLTNSYGYHVYDAHYNQYGTYLSGSQTRALTQSTWPLDVEDHFYYNQFDELEKDNNRSYADMIRPGRIHPGVEGLVRLAKVGNMRTDAAGNSLNRAGYGFALQSASLGGAGVLMNNYNQLLIQNPIANVQEQNGHTISNFYRLAIIEMDKYFGVGPQYSRRMTNRTTSSVSNPSGMVIPETGSYNQHANGDRWNPFGAGGALWEAGQQAGKMPFYDSYEEFSKNIRLVGKNYSVLPEYRISNHLDELLVGRAPNTIQGVFEITGGEPGKNRSDQQDFYKTYSHSDFMKLFEVVEEDHEGFGQFGFLYDPADSKPLMQRLTLKCSVIKKFLPYEGFYPCQRTAQISEQFYADAKDYTQLKTIGGEIQNSTNQAGLGILVEYANSNFHFQNIMKPMFAPGVLFNTIKAGVACDYPIYTVYAGGSGFVLNNYFSIGDPASSGLSYPNDWDEPATSATILDYYNYLDYNHRIPFEALVEPSRFLANKDIATNEPHISGAVSCSANWDGTLKTDKFVMMTNNFLAEVPEFFLKDEKFTTMTSKTSDDPTFGHVIKDRVYGMRIKMRRSMNQPRSPVSASIGVPYHPPQDMIIPTFQNGQTSMLHETITMYSRPSAFGPPSYGFNVMETGNLTGSVYAKTWEGRNPGAHGAQGTPITGITAQRNAGISFTGSNSTTFFKDSRNGYNFPYTPPYYHGESWIDLYYTASATGKVSVHEIVNNLDICYNRFDYGHYACYGATSGIRRGLFQRSFGPQAVTNINKNAMQLSASIDFLTKKTTEGSFMATSFAPGGVVRTVPVNDPDVGVRWCIQTKFETPILNFNHISVANGNLKLPSQGANGNFGTPRGMWHQYGAIPSASEGIYLETGDIPFGWYRRDSLTNVESLADVVGFDSIPRKLGQVATNKRVYEAVVAVPYYMLGEHKKFVKLNQTAVNAVLDSTIGPNSPLLNEQFSETIRDQLEKMKKYVFPPELDFINNRSLDPVAMYIFEFHMDFSQKDLADIWQNLPPDGCSYIGNDPNAPQDEFSMEEQTISHNLDYSEMLFGGYGEVGNPQYHSMHRQLTVLSDKSKLRWMLFKVKQRAAGFYYDKLLKSQFNLFQPAANAERSRIKNLVLDGVQSNWPYDYFSIVELAKLDADIEFTHPGQFLHKPQPLMTQEEAPADLSGVFAGTYEEPVEVELTPVIVPPNANPTSRWYTMYTNVSGVPIWAMSTQDDAGNKLVAKMEYIDTITAYSGGDREYYRSKYVPPSNAITPDHQQSLYDAAKDAYIEHRRVYLRQNVPEFMGTGMYAQALARQRAEFQAEDRFRGRKNIAGHGYCWVIRDRVEPRPGDIQ